MSAPRKKTAKKKPTKKVIRKRGPKPIAPVAPISTPLRPDQLLDLDMIQIGMIADKMFYRVSAAAKADAMKSNQDGLTDTAFVGNNIAEEFLHAGRALWLILARLEADAEALRAVVS